MKSMSDFIPSDGKPLPEGMHEYGFDVKLFAAVRVVAADEKAAIEAMEKVIDSMEPGEHWIGGFNDTAQSVRITEVTLSQDGEYENCTPFEIDGEPQ